MRSPTFLLKLLLAGVLILSAGNSCAVLADDLANVEDSTKDSNKGKRRSSRSHHHCDDDDPSFSEYLIGEIFGPPIVFTLTAPWWGPVAMVGDDYSVPAEFPHYPYSGENAGYLTFSSDADGQLSGWGMKLSSEYGNDFSGLERIGGRLQLDTQSRLGIDTEWNYWEEELSRGKDTLWTGDVNLIYRFAQSERAQFYTGLGVNWLSGHRGDAGFNFTYGVDLFPAEPIVLRTVLDAGTVGDADLYHNKTTIGLVYKHCELFTGYDILHIGDTNLHGFIGGLTLWW